LANLPVYLIHNHKPSLGLPFGRENVEIVFHANVETDTVKTLVFNKISTFLNE
jgi:hypothetical protein